VVVVGRDKRWALYSMETGQALTVVNDPAVEGSFECLAFHPDGLLLGTGTSANAVRMWDAKIQANVATFTDHTGSVKSIAFSENG
jgi:pre-mRNA-processing factor 19